MASGANGDLTIIVDHLVRLETFVREAFIKKEHLTDVFFDLEKAYDTTWKYGNMRDLNFLSNRNFKVRVGTTLSDRQGQEEGFHRAAFYLLLFLALK